MTDLNFALYRSQLRSLNPKLKEGDIYRMYYELEYGSAWLKKAQFDPEVGGDGRFHFVYISICEDRRFYVGKHSTKDLNDGYIGSGTLVKELHDAGRVFVSIPLEFFPSSDAAFVREAEIVNDKYLTQNGGLVLNRIPGGKDAYFKKENRKYFQDKVYKDNSQNDDCEDEVPADEIKPSVPEDELVDGNAEDD